MRRISLFSSGLLLSLFAAAPAFAASGFVIGFVHPILGFDHFVAMIAVGLLSVQLGGRAIWTVPGAFVLFLAIGGAMGLAGMPLIEVEGAIAISVLALGLAIAARAALPMLVAMLFVGFFAVFHGHAHGAEIPFQAEPAMYVLGFVAASALLHLIGVGLGLLSRYDSLRAKLGAGVAGIGLHMVMLTYSLV